MSPDIRVDSVRKLSDALNQGGSHKLDYEQVLSTKLFLVVTQCCDIEKNRRILVAETRPASSLRLDKLLEDERDAFERNLPGVSDMPEEDRSAGGSIRGVYVGYFYLAPHEGLVEEPQVASFELIKGIRRSELQYEYKVAELSVEQRHRLRDRLAACFGRVPDEDQRELRDVGLISD